MNRRRTVLAAAGLLLLPGLLLGFYPRPYYPPARWVTPAPYGYVLPFDPCVCPPPLVVRPADCPPAVTPPPKPANPPKVMEKVEAPQPRVVSPTAATEPTPDPKKADPPKVELATPVPTVPDMPAEKPKAKPPEAPLTVPPIDVKPAKPAEAPPKLDVPPIKTETPLKLELSLPGNSEPKKTPETPLPPFTLPKLSESKYRPAAGEPTVKVVAVEGRRTAGNQTVNFYNYTDRDLEMQIDGKAAKLPAKSSLALALPDRFTWKLGDRSQTATIPTDAAGLSVVVQSSPDPR